MHEKIKDDVPRFVNGTINIMGTDVGTAMPALHSKDDAEYVLATIDYTGAEYSIAAPNDATSFISILKELTAQILSVI